MLNQHSHPELPKPKDEEIDFLNFDTLKTENKENETPKPEQQGEENILDLDFSLTNDAQNTETIQSTQIDFMENLNLTPVPTLPPPKKKILLEDIDEFNLFTNLKK